MENLKTLDNFQPDGKFGGVDVHKLNTPLASF